MSITDTQKKALRLLQRRMEEHRVAQEKRFIGVGSTEDTLLALIDVLCASDEGLEKAMEEMK